MISREEIAKLAKLARLQLDETGSAALSHDLEKILAYVDQLKKVGRQTKTTSPVAANHSARNVWREDKNAHETAEFSAELLAAAPKHDDNFVRVKKII